MLSTTKAIYLHGFVAKSFAHNLKSMSQDERVAAIQSNMQFREAAFEPMPAALSGFDEATRSELRRRIALEEHPQIAAQLRRNAASAAQGH